jgi:hypothetical protein
MEEGSDAEMNIGHYNEEMESDDEINMNGGFGGSSDDEDSFECIREEEDDEGKVKEVNEPELRPITGNQKEDCKDGEQKDEKIGMRQSTASSTFKTTGGLQRKGTAFKPKLVKKRTFKKKKAKKSTSMSATMSSLSD